MIIREHATESESDERDRLRIQRDRIARIYGHVAPQPRQPEQPTPATEVQHG